MEMTIHQALSELKLIDSKISKLIQELVPVSSHKKDEKVGGIIEQDEFNKNAKAKYQAITDLIKRKFAMKAAIVKANAETMIEVGNMKMSIADSITYRSIITAKKDLARHIGRTYNTVLTNITNANKAVDENAMELAKQAVGAEQANKNQKDAQAIIGPYVEANKLHMIDPLKAVKTIEELEEEVDNFDSQIDAALSVANAITKITVE